jgi:hypothetical protein
MNRNSINNIFKIWFDKINYYKVYNFDNFIPCRQELQNFINNYNQEFEVSELQESILNIIRNNMLEFCVDDIYNIILEHLIIKDIFNLIPKPIKFKDILTKRLETINEIYHELPIIWVEKNYQVFSQFRQYFE